MTCLLLFLPTNFIILCGVAYSFDYIFKHVFVFNVLLSKETCPKIVDIRKMRFSFQNWWLLAKISHFNFELRLLSSFLTIDIIRGNMLDQQWNLFARRLSGSFSFSCQWQWRPNSDIDFYSSYWDNSNGNTTSQSGIVEIFLTCSGDSARNLCWYHAWYRKA